MEINPIVLGVVLNAVLNLAFTSWQVGNNLRASHTLKLHPIEPEKVTHMTVRPIRISDQVARIH